MGDRGPLFVLEVESGQGPSGPLCLEPGRKLETTSLGSRGQWVVVGPGVRDVHGYLAFDGATLFLRSASPAYPLRVEGVPVYDAWQPVAPPVRIAVGGATLTYSASGGEASFAPAPPAPRLADDEATRFHPVEVPPAPYVAPPARHLAGGYDVGDDDATRPGVSLEELGPTGDFDRTRVNLEPPVPPSATLHMPAPLPAAGMPPPGMAPSTAPLAFAPPPGPPPGPQGALLDLPPPPLPQSPATSATPGWRKALDRGLAEWKATSGPKKALLALLPFAFFAVYVLFDDPSRQAAAPPAATTAPSPATGTATTVAPARPAAAPTQPPPEAPAPAATVVTPQTRAAIPPTAVPGPAPAAVAAGRATPERQAVDAVVAGAYADAARRYDDLAREHPEQPVYREAARILRAKAEAGSP